MTHRLTNLPDSPEAATVKFVCRRAYLSVVDSTVYINELTFTLAFKHILANELRLKVGNTQFLTHLTSESLFRSLAIVYMASHGGIPFTWLYVFPLRPSLQKYLTL